MTLRNYNDERGPATRRANKGNPDTKQAAWVRWGSERNEARCTTWSWSIVNATSAAAIGRTAERCAHRLQRMDACGQSQAVWSNASGRNRGVACQFSKRATPQCAVVQRICTRALLTEGQGHASSLAGPSSTGRGQLGVIRRHERADWLQGGLLEGRDKGLTCAVSRCTQAAVCANKAPVNPAQVRGIERRHADIRKRTQREQTTPPPLRSRPVIGRRLE